MRRSSLGNDRVCACQNQQKRRERDWSSICWSQTSMADCPHGILRRSGRSAPSCGRLAWITLTSELLAVVEQTCAAAAPLPPGGPHALAGASEPDANGGSQGNPSQSRDCHQSKQLCTFRRVQASDLRVCAPGRTRTCTLRIRSETGPVRLVLPWSIAARRIRSAVRRVQFRAIPLQRPDCQRDCHSPQASSVIRAAGRLAGAKMEVHPAALPLDLVNLALAVVFEASLERFPRPCGFEGAAGIG